MIPEDIRRHGAALAERVRQGVDTSLRLDLMLHRRRRDRFVRFATAAVAIAMLIVGSLWLAVRVDRTVVTEPPATVTTTNAGLQSLPVETYVVLLSDYAVDPDTGECRGTGALLGVGAGSDLDVIDPSATGAIPVVTLSAGEEVTTVDPRAAFLLPSGVPTACAFSLPDLGLSIEEYADISLLPESDPDIASGMTIRGQRVIYRFGEIPGESGFERAPGVVSDDPEVWQAELEEMRTSAGPGRLVGFVNLAAPHNSGAPTSPDQPVCEGTGPYRDIVPGTAVTVTNAAGRLLGETILNGSAYDGHIGCSLWFATDVDGAVDVYAIGIGDHPEVSFDQATLDRVGWKVDLWSDTDHMQANCVEADDTSEPMTCVWLGPVP